MALTIAEPKIDSTISFNLDDHLLLEKCKILKYFKGFWINLNVPKTSIISFFEYFFHKLRVSFKPRIFSIQQGDSCLPTPVFKFPCNFQLATRKWSQSSTSAKHFYASVKMQLALCNDVLRMVPRIRDRKVRMESNHSWGRSIVPRRRLA